MSRFVLVATVCIAHLVGGCRPSSPEATVALDTLAYVGREACAECHPSESMAWTGSDHDLAMTNPSPQTVLGDFDEAVFTECGVRTRFISEDGVYYVETQGPDGDVSTFAVAYTFGHFPLQQYLLSTSGGRLQAFTIAWDSVHERWFSLYPDDCFGPGDWLHWTGDGMTWNHMCAECHSTNVRRNFDLATETYQTSYSEVDVSCEACHGPGERHVELVRADSYGEGAGDGKEDIHPGTDPDLPVGKDRVDLAGTDRDDLAGTDRNYLNRTGLTVDLSTGETSREGLRQRTEHSRQVETCAPCHSRRRAIHPDFIAGRSYLDHFAPALLEEGLYYADGRIDDEVFVYGSFVQSKMYENGVQCADCHDPHTTKLKLDGNALCAQCHEPEQYDSFEHLRHEVGEAGSQCVDCHMPERTYMVIDPRRDHSFSVPRPDLTARIGTPNACNGCHEDRTATWAADAIAEWHGPERPDSFAPAIAGGRGAEPEAEPELLRIVQERKAPEIVRATALSLLGRYPTVRAWNASVEALEDPAPLVRAEAVSNLAEAEDRNPAPQIEPLTRDPVRLVRIEAARALTLLDPGRYAESPESEAARAYWSALEEYRAGQLALSDQAASHLNLAVLHESLGESGEAEAAYRTAIRLDSSFVPAHMNLALLYDRRRSAAEAVGLSDSANVFFERAVGALRLAVTLEPSSAQAHYSLGLLLAERPDLLEAAADHLTEAARLDSSNARIQYNAGLAQQRLGRAALAETFLRRAHRLAPEHPDYVDALSIFLAQQERWEEALWFTNLLLQQYPNNPGLRERKAYIERNLHR